MDPLRLKPEQVIQSRRPGRIANGLEPVRVFGWVGLPGARALGEAFRIPLLRVHVRPEHLNAALGQGLHRGHVRLLVGTVRGGPVHAGADGGEDQIAVAAGQVMRYPVPTIGGLLAKPLAAALPSQVKERHLAVGRPPANGREDQFLGTSRRQDIFDRSEALT